MWYPLLVGLWLALVPPLPAQRDGSSDPPQNGYWEPAFEHDLAGFDPAPARFNALHMALVPRGPHRGHVLVWDVQGPQASAAWDQRWAILDASAPGAPVFWNGELTLPENGGDFFCAGHAWTSGGELLVAGGTTRYPGADDHHGDGIVGGKLVFLWDPGGGLEGTWRRQLDLAVDRWYPTVVLLDTGELLIAGGTPGGDQPDLNDYEVFAPRRGLHGRTRLRPAGRFPGPELPADEFRLYPRIHQLENGEQFVSGPSGATAKMNHALAPGAWSYTDTSALGYRKHVNSVLAPRRPGAPQCVWTIGGDAYDEGGAALGPLDTVESCEPGASGAPAWNWTALSAMRAPRARANAVLLPDGTVLVIGGRSDLGAEDEEAAVLEPGLFDGQHWRTMSRAGSSRTYHSTALLLPSGKVLTAGGNSSTRDYQVFVPPYVLSAARPRILAAPTALPYSHQNPAIHGALFAPLPEGEFVERVVLLAPGSVTHHFDASQRYVELALESLTATSVSFHGPSHAALAPRGHYMLFLVTASGIPSVARWVYVG